MVIEYSKIEELATKKNKEIINNTRNKAGLNHLYLTKIMHPTDESHWQVIYQQLLL